MELEQSQHVHQSSTERGMRTCDNVMELLEPFRAGAVTYFDRRLGRSSVRALFRYPASSAVASIAAMTRSKTCKVGVVCNGAAGGIERYLQGAKVWHVLQCSKNLYHQIYHFMHFYTWFDDGT